MIISMFFYGKGSVVKQGLFYFFFLAEDKTIFLHKTILFENKSVNLEQN